MCIVFRGYPTAITTFSLFRTREVVKITLKHESENVREFYSKFSHPARMGSEATGSMQWSVNLMEESGQ